MLLARLRVRGKLAVLVATPLVMVMVLAAIVSAERFNRAAAASRTVQAVNVASQVGAIVADLQQERLVSVGYLLGTATSSDLALATALANDKIVDVVGDIEGEISPATDLALTAVHELDPIRQYVIERHISPTDAIDAFSQRINQILSSLRLADGVDASTAAGREVIALDALLRIDELNNRSAAQLVAAAGTKSSQSIVAYAGSRTAVDGILSQFTAYATGDQLALYGLVGKAFNNRIGASFAASFAAAPASTIAQESPTVIYPELTSFGVLGRFVETKIAADVTSAVTTREHADLFTAYGTAGLALLMVLLIALLSIAVARSVADPLTQLTLTADRVARLAQAELERVADDEADSADPVRLEAVQVDAQDEVGDLARAFERVQGTAARLVERQVQSRRNVAEMLGHIGRRTQNLVGRQIAVIDGLEAEETDSNRLSELYRLDHIASRLRRNAGSLVVLSGASDSGGHFAPLPLADVTRLALGEIEAYTRVDVAVPDSLLVSPAVINDLVLMLAELMENATTFSPPHTRVSVTATERDRRLVIIDHGIGLSDARLIEENRRLAQRERLDLVPSEVLGLFVVGRLARRHGVEVVLANTPGGGVTVRMDLSNHLMDHPTEVVQTGVDSLGTARIRATATVPALSSGAHALPDDDVADPYWGAPAVRAAEVAGAAVEGEALPAEYAELTAIAALGSPLETDVRGPWTRSSTADVDENRYDLDRDVDERRPSHQSSLDRAIRMLETASPWNAFELPQPALPAGTWIRDQNGEAQAAAEPAEDRDGTTDREPSGTSEDAPPDTRFDFGGYPTAPVSPAPISAPLPTRPVRPVPPRQVRGSDYPPAGGTDYEPVTVNARSYDLPGFVAPEVDQDGPFTHRFSNNGMPLARRVPGATTRDAHTMPVPRQGRPELDPSEARQLVEQFEFGVARALREVEPEPRGTEEE